MTAEPRRFIQSKLAFEVEGNHINRSDIINSILDRVELLCVSAAEPSLTGLLKELDSDDNTIEVVIEDKNEENTPNLTRGHVTITLHIEARKVCLVISAIESIAVVKSFRARFSLIVIEDINDLKAQVRDRAKELEGYLSEPKLAITSPDNMQSKQNKQHHYRTASKIHTEAASFGNVVESAVGYIKYGYRKVSNYPIIVALFLLIIVPVALIQNAIDTANNISIAAFFLIIIGIAWKIISYMREKPFLQAEYDST